MVEFFLILAILGAEPQTLSGRVIHVTDGDTITVIDSSDDKHKVRLLGIDAPEIGHGRGKPGQPFGARSKERLEELLDGKTVEARWSERDRYGRLLGDVWVDGTWINREMVRSGLAWHYTRYDKRPELAEAEHDARTVQAGLWGDKDPVPPWDWRKRQTADSAAAK